MIASALTALAAPGWISGSGFAIAKITGFFAIFARYSGLRAPAALTPTKTSAPYKASSSVRLFVSAANSSLCSFIPAVLPLNTTPRVSHTITFYFLTPYVVISRMQAMPAAPAPFRTSLIYVMSFLAILSELIRPAKHTMAVPCWSSWKTGIFISSFNFFSM